MQCKYDLHNRLMYIINSKLCENPVERATELCTTEYYQAISERYKFKIDC